jgi:hypothetical protein
VRRPCIDLPMSDGKKPSDSVSSVRLAANERVTSIDPRTHAAWRTWLAALAHDADAVTAAALAYEQLDPAGRSAWLDALEADASDVGVPRVALYAPLLGVEQDDERRARIAKNVEGAARRSTPSRALAGGSGADRICIIVSPLYLDFVEVLLCRYGPDDGIVEARHHWLAHKSDVEALTRDVGVKLEEAPLPAIVEEIAHAVVADRRRGQSSPPILLRYLDLFAPDLERDGDIDD